MKNSGVTFTQMLGYLVTKIKYTQNQFTINKSLVVLEYVILWMSAKEASKLRPFSCLYTIFSYTDEDRLYYN